MKDYSELAVIGASDSTPRQVEKAVHLLDNGDIPMAKIADPILPMSEIRRAFQIMEERGGMRVVLRPGSGS